MHDSAARGRSWHARENWLPHFQGSRATGITAYLESGRTLENAQLMAAHESPYTPKRYDRTGNEITLDEVGTLYVLRTGRTAPAL